MADKKLSDLLPMVDTVMQAEDGTVILIAEEENGLYSVWTTNFKLAIRVERIAEGLLSKVFREIDDWKPNWELIGNNGNPFADICVWTKWIGREVIASVSQREQGSAMAKELPVGTWLNGEDTERLFELLGRKVEEVKEEDRWTFDRRLAT